MNELYKKLDVQPDASDSEIKKAYWDKSKDCHPDKNNGDDKEFKEVSQAYQVLIHPGKRKEYDETGKVGTDDKMSKVYKILGTIFLDIIQRGDECNRVDVFAWIKKSIVQGQGQLEAKIEKDESELERLESIKSRIAKDNNNYFTNIIDDQIRTAKGSMNSLKDQFDSGNDAIEFISDCEYNFDSVEDSVTSLNSFMINMVGMA